MQTITQTNDEEVKLVVSVRDSRRRHLKAVAARLGKDMGAVVEDALDKLIGVPPPNSPEESKNGA